MIKFFRKIRYNLMSENKTGKYLKYAIGEIVLVIIGILIALSINNRNEENKFHAQVIDQLILLSEEINLDIITYNQIIEYYPREIDYLKKLTRGEYQDLDLSLFFSIVAVNTAEINFGDTYKTLKENGGLNTIKDLELRKEMLSYHNFNRETYIRMHRYHLDLVVGHIEPKVLELMEYDSNNKLVRENTIKIIEEKKLNNIFNSQLKNNQYVLDIVKQNLEEAQELKELLDTYIKKHND